MREYCNIAQLYLMSDTVIVNDDFVHYNNYACPIINFLVIFFLSSSNPADTAYSEPLQADMISMDSGFGDTEGHGKSTSH